MHRDTDVIVEWIDKELVLETQNGQSPIAATYLNVDGNAFGWRTVVKALHSSVQLKMVSRCSEKPLHVLHPVCHLFSLLLT